MQDSLEETSLRRAFGSPGAKARYVRRLFSTIADRYDVITVLLSYGQDRRWKRRVGELAALRRGERVLDLACGTGDLALLAAGRGAWVIGLDVTPRMIALAHEKARVAGGVGPRWIIGDMMGLPFGDAVFDVVTAGYGLRNVPELEPALAEIHRVLRPGGRFLSLDFNRPSSALVRGAYLGYLTVVGSALGLALHGDPDTYRYIPASIRRYPGASAVADRLRRIGFAEVTWQGVLGGLMAIHAARKREPSAAAPVTL